MEQIGRVIALVTAYVAIQSWAFHQHLLLAFRLITAAGPAAAFLALMYCCEGFAYIEKAPEQPPAIFRGRLIEAEESFRNYPLMRGRKYYAGRPRLGWLSLIMAAIGWLPLLWLTSYNALAVVLGAGGLALACGLFVIHQSANGRQCERCKEVVKLEAQVCRYCGHEFSPEPEPPYTNEDVMEALRTGSDA